MIAVNHRQLLVSVATQRGISGGGWGAFGMCVRYFRQAKFVILACVSPSISSPFLSSPEKKKNLKFGSHCRAKHQTLVFELCH